MWVFKKTFTLSWVPLTRRLGVILKLVDPD